LTCASVVFEEIDCREVVGVVQLHGDRVDISAETYIWVGLGVDAWDTAGSVLEKIPESTWQLGEEFNGAANRETFSRSLGGIANITDRFLFCVAG
jgi:hypothetical protein